ncbi:DNA-directed RNA polymerase subunit omega [Clostridium sp. MD294]|uniref:DNA-directed RNA polymerase subunit omega n=1 Tax=Clostridium sp. MD294 TaxID=97138 RepID=UPI0002CB6D63|nr:DNA-directed RNA polymerase subunit omega [Clostridium sp. MD294]NDO46808.1 DNA-directed RNA polymerase subunit omega [Clostridium sp. MD294]USF28750.1 DNA-directed RNA polymerase subunit omega [Clostridium sp. MD294]
MLRPSYSDLLEVLNKDADTENVIGSRYTIVIAAAKRARQLVDHAEPMTTRTQVDRSVSIAVNELWEGKIKIIQNDSSRKEEDIWQEDTEE